MDSSTLGTARLPILWVFLNTLVHSMGSIILYPLKMGLDKVVYFVDINNELVHFVNLSVNLFTLWAFGHFIFNPLERRSSITIKSSAL